MLKLTVKGFDTVTPQVQAAVEAGIQQGLAVAGVRGQKLVTDNITHGFLGRPPAVATGVLANSIQFEISKAVGLSRAVIFAAPPADQYAAYVESGTGPHFPPPHALLLWVERKFSPPDEKHALAICFAIARTIARRGTSAFGMFARAFAVLEPELAGIFEAAIARAIAAAGLGKA